MWGLTFKANTDDLRQSPALHIIERLLAPGRTGARLRPGRVRAASSSCPASRWCPTPTRRAREPRCWPCSPSGTSSSWVDLDKLLDVMAAPSHHGRPQPARPGRGGPPRLHLPGRGSRRWPGWSSPAGPGSWGRTCARRSCDRGDEVVVPRQPVHRSGGQHRAPLRPSRLHLRRAGREPVHLGARPGRRRAALRQPGLARRLPRAAHPDPQGGQPGHAQLARPGPGQAGPVLAGLHQRGVRRSRGASPARGLLGQRQPRRAPRRSTTRPSGSPRPSPWRTTARYGLDVRIVRIFNTYGPRMRPDDGRVVSNFIDQALTASR